MLLLLGALAVLSCSFLPAGDMQTGPPAQSVRPFHEITVSGVIQLVVDDGSPACEICQACSDCAGTHLVLDVRGRRTDIHLAPRWFLDRSGFDFSPGDVVSVTGTRITIQREHGIAAREVRRGDVVMKLRDEHGLPLWRRALTNDEPFQ